MRSYPKTKTTTTTTLKQEQKTHAGNSFLASQGQWTSPRKQVRWIHTKPAFIIQGQTSLERTILYKI